MANGSVGGGGGAWSASNSTRASERTAKRLNQAERATYNTMRSQGLSDKQARREIYSQRRFKGDTPF